VDPESVAWIEELEAIYTAFNSNLKQRDRPAVAREVRRMGTLLMIRSAQINGWIVSTASGLHLERIAAAMQTVPSDRLVAAGAVAADSLRQQLASLVTQHNRWQQLEPNLQQLRRDLERDTQGFMDEWPDASKQIMELCAGQAEANVERLKRACGEVDALVAELHADDELVEAHMSDLRRRYAMCEREAGQRFVLVDKDLVAVCKDLNDLRAPLKDLADTLTGALV
jgi:hypothetical protein